ARPASPGDPCASAARGPGPSSSPGGPETATARQLRRKSSFLLPYCRRCINDISSSVACQSRGIERKMVLFDLNGTLTDPGAIGGAWGAPDLGVAVLARAVQSAMVDAILGNSRAFSEHIEAALRDEVGRLGLEPERIDEALEAGRAHKLRS